MSVEISNGEIVSDKFGVDWYVFTYRDVVGVKLYGAISRGYEASQYPFIHREPSWSNVQNRIDAYAAKHQTHLLAEEPFKDQNGVEWTIVSDKGLITDDLAAVTSGYPNGKVNGALITANSDGDLRAEIFLFADKHASIVKPPPVGPDPVTPPPVVNPPPQPPPLPPSPAEGTSTGGIIVGGLAIAGLIYLLRD